MIKRFMRRFFNKVTIGAICFVAIALVLVFTSVQNNRLAEQSSDDAVHSISKFYLKELGERRSLTISNRLTQAEENISRIFGKSGKKYFQNQDDLRSYLGSIRKIYDYDKLAVVDENELMYTEHSTISGVSRYSFLTEEITKPSIYMANLYGSRKQLILVVPLKGVRISTVSMKLTFIQIDLDRILGEISDETDEHETFSDIYYKNGQTMTSEEVTGSAPVNILDSLQCAEFTDGHQFEEVKVDFRSGRTGFVSYKIDDVVSYMYYTPVKGTNWMFAVTIRESSISSNIADIRDSMLDRGNFQIVLIVIVMLVSFGLFIWYSSRLQKQEKHHLLKMSQTDAMTGVYNRGGGEKAIRAALNLGAEGLFFLLDADKFKSINDNYGHDVGDQVIISIANALTYSFRDDDIVMRLGGDEFAVYAPGILDMESAARVVRRFFGAIDTIDIPSLGDRKISVSLGAAFWKGEEQLEFDELYKRADLKLYDSKQTEGNMVTFYED